MKRRLDSLEATQGAPRDPRRDSRGEWSPWLPLETRLDSPGEPGSHLNERILKTTELINLPDPMSYYKLIRVVSLTFVLPGSRAHMVTEKVLNDC